jgi:hypothetical protein
MSAIRDALNLGRHHYLSVNVSSVTCDMTSISSQQQELLDRVFSSTQHPCSANRAAEKSFLVIRPKVYILILIQSAADLVIWVCLVTLLPLRELFLTECYQTGEKNGFSAGATAKYAH